MTPPLLATTPSEPPATTTDEADYWLAHYWFVSGLRGARPSKSKMIPWLRQLTLHSPALLRAQKSVGRSARSQQGRLRASRFQTTFRQTRRGVAPKALAVPPLPRAQR